MKRPCYDPIFTELSCGKRGWGRVLIVIAVVVTLGVAVMLALSGCAARSGGVVETTTVTAPDGTVTRVVKEPVGDPFDDVQMRAAESLFGLTGGRAMP